MINKHICVLWATLLISFYIDAQDTLVYNIPKVYNFENIQGDTIANAQFAVTFFEKLYAQKQRNNQKINILHIGDSHLQADYITHTTRVSLQKIFGNAGRGFVSPLKISKSNEPFNYQTTSSNNWKSTRCVSSKISQSIGLGGMSIKTQDSNALIQLKTYNTDSMDYSFNKIILYHTKADSTYTIQISDSSSNQLFPSQQPELPYRSTFLIAKNKSIVKISTLKTDTIQKSFTFFGALLENGNSGILYHCVGINGAKYKDYFKTADFCNQTSSLSPDVILISLGTNESFQKNYNSEKFYKEIDTLVSKLYIANPNAPIILTTPANSFYYHHINNNLPLIRQTIIQYASDKKLAYWDLFSITGGEKSAVLWKKANLLSKDGIHYSKDGYIHQGNLLTKAIINAYNKYVSIRQ